MVFLVTFHGYSLPSHSVLSASLLLPLSLPLISPCSPSSPFPLSVTTRFLYSHGLFFSPALPSADNGTPPALSTGTSFPCSTDLALSNT